MKRKSISINKYNKIMDSIIGQNMTVSDTFIAMIEEAGKYEIKQSEKEYKKADKK